MGIQVNLQDDTAESGFQVNLDPAGLPEGVYNVGDEVPDGRVEIFRVNGRVYTLNKRVDPRIVFRMIRDIHKGGAGSDVAQANLLYEVLGDAVIDYLADEELSDEEYEQVMKAVQKHTMKAAKKILGN